jgi:hypothetical protein
MKCVIRGEDGASLVSGGRIANREQPKPWKKIEFVDTKTGSDNPLYNFLSSLICDYPAPENSLKDGVSTEPAEKEKSGNKKYAVCETCLSILDTITEKPPYPAPRKQ